MLTVHTLSILLALATQVIAQQCNSQMYVRRDFRELIDQQNPNRLLPAGEAFMTGVRCLADRRGSATASVWDDFTRTHMTAAGPAHGTAAFLPWHRLFLLSLEIAMRECTGNQDIYIPYWDAAADSQAPESAAVWRFFGSNGGCVSSGILSQMPQPTIPNRHCISRSFDSSSLPSVEAVAFISTATDYPGFKNGLEASIHAAVHNWIGGDMRQMYSTNDPVFYLHHANIDRIWAEWQIRYPNLANTYSGNVWGGGQASVNDQMDMDAVRNYIGNRPVSALFSTRNWCYTYSSGGAPITPTNPSPGPTAPTNPGGFPEWRFCSASSECSSNCCSTRWANDGRMKCHPTSACPSTPGPTTPNPPATTPNAQGNLPVWGFCSASSECSSGCCSQRWSNDGRMKCHPGSACPASGSGNSNNNRGGSNGGGSTPNPSSGTCGGGNRGNGVCPSGECCSTWGWCGTTASHCAGRNLRKRDVHEQRYYRYIQYQPQEQHYNEYTPMPIPQQPQQQPYQPEPPKEEPKRYHGNPKNHITPATDDRDDYMNIRKYSPIPEEYCIMNNLNVTEVRMTEQKIYNVIEKLNEREDYVSPCALINRSKDHIYRPYDPEEKLDMEKKVEHVVEEVKEGKAPEPRKEEAPKGGEVKQVEVEQKPPGQEPKQQQGPASQGPPNQQGQEPPQGPAQQGPAKFYYFAGSPRK